jgi:hypothetical protein
VLKHFQSRIDYVSGGKRPLVCYFSNDLNIHRTKTEKANDLWLISKWSGLFGGVKTFPI